MFEQDGANHRRLRGLLSHAFTPRRAAELRPAVERTADELLDALPTGEPVDLVAGYTRPLATNLLAGARLAVPVEQLRWRPATFLRRLESLPVILDPAP
jgi:cytochrome P450 PksS